MRGAAVSPGYLVQLIIIGCQTPLDDRCNHPKMGPHASLSKFRPLAIVVQPGLVKRLLSTSALRCNPTCHGWVGFNFYPGLAILNPDGSGNWTQRHRASECANLTVASRGGHTFCIANGLICPKHRCARFAALCLAITNTTPEFYKHGLTTQ